MEKDVELIFNTDANNNYIGKAECPFCKGTTEYMSFEGCSTMSGCEHIESVKRVEDNKLKAFYKKERN